MIQLMVSLIMLILPIPPWADCNVSNIQGLVCKEEIHLVHLPIVQGGNTPPAPPPIVRWEEGLLDWDYKDWCNENQPECQEWPGTPFEYEAPPGYVVSFVRLFSYAWERGGAHFLYPNEGCIMKVCVDSVEGSIWEKTATKIKIYIDEDRIGWGGPINLVDICHEMEGYPYTKVCDTSYYTKYPTFQVDFNTKK